MKLLKENFRRDGLLYTLLKRNDMVALYSIGGTNSDKVTHYEVCKAYIRKDRFGERESLPTNEQFGRDRSRCFIRYTSALNYFDELTNLYHRVPKVFTEVKEAA